MNHFFLCYYPLYDDNDQWQRDNLSIQKTRNSFPFYLSVNCNDWTIINNQYHSNKLKFLHIHSIICLWTTTTTTRLIMWISKMDDWKNNNIYCENINIFIINIIIVCWFDRKNEWKHDWFIIIINFLIIKTKQNKKDVPSIFFLFIIDVFPKILSSSLSSN